MFSLVGIIILILPPWSFTFELRPWMSRSFLAEKFVCVHVFISLYGWSNHKHMWFRPDIGNWRAAIVVCFPRTAPHKFEFTYKGICLDVHPCFYVVYNPYYVYIYIYTYIDNRSNIITHTSAVIIYVYGYAYWPLI